MIGIEILTTMIIGVARGFTWHVDGWLLCVLWQHQTNRTSHEITRPHVCNPLYLSLGEKVLSMLAYQLANCLLMEILKQGKANIDNFEGQTSHVGMVCVLWAQNGRAINLNLLRFCPSQSCPYTATWWPTC